MPRFAKVSEIADRFRVSADAVYLWIRHGKIPADCVVRIAGTIRVDEEQFEKCLRSGELYQPRGRKLLAANGPGSAEPRVSVMAEDNFTTSEGGPGTEHRWTSETGSVLSNHPFSPEMIGATRIKPIESKRKGL
jgi:hypothetical protein